LKGGTVSLIPAGEGQTYSTTINEDGTYAFDQIHSGKYKVCVETTSLKGGGGGGGAAAGPKYGGKSAGAGIDKSKIKNEPPPGAQLPEGYRMAEALGGTGEAAKRFVAIPPQFADSDQTPLTLEVKGGPQTYDIPLN